MTGPPALPGEDDTARPSARLRFLPAVLIRSVVLLRLLLQDDAIDLELASSVVALDPGLAFGVLQLANADSDSPAAPIWQLPSALVAAGREPLQALLQYAPRLESTGMATRRLAALARNAVVRASIAQLLARELGCCHSKKAYLASLLFDISEMVALSRLDRELDRHRLLAVMAASLPAPVAKVAIAGRHSASESADTLTAITLLAEALRRESPAGRESDLAAAPYWRHWPDCTGAQRDVLVRRCAELAGWAAENLYRLQPWDFLSRLERRRYPCACGEKRQQPWS